MTRKEDLDKVINIYSSTVAAQAAQNLLQRNAAEKSTREREEHEKSREAYFLNMFDQTGVVDLFEQIRDAFVVKGSENSDKAKVDVRVHKDYEKKDEYAAEVTLLFNYHMEHGDRAYDRIFAEWRSFDRSLVIKGSGYNSNRKVVGKDGNLVELVGKALASPDRTREDHAWENYR